jgi:hypothetical protein
VIKFGIMGSPRTSSRWIVSSSEDDLITEAADGAGLLAPDESGVWEIF